MPKIGHLCFPIAFFGHFQYTRTDQERIPHSPSGGDFHGKVMEGKGMKRMDVEIKKIGINITNNGGDKIPPPSLVLYNNNFLLYTSSNFLIVIAKQS
jgi:hypothetical protein